MINIALIACGAFFCGNPELGDAPAPAVDAHVEDPAQQSRGAAKSDALLSPMAIGLTADWGEIVRRAAGFAAAYRFRTATFAPDGSQRLVDHDDGLLEFDWSRSALRIVRTSVGESDGDRHRGRVIDVYSLLRGEYVSVQREVGGLDNVLIDYMSAPPTLATVVLGELPVAWRMQPASVDFAVQDRVHVRFQTREGMCVTVEMQALDRPLPSHWIFQKDTEREDFWLLGNHHDASTARSVPTAIANIKRRGETVLMAGLWVRADIERDASVESYDVEAGAVVFDARVPGTHGSAPVDRKCAAQDLLSWMTIPTSGPIPRSRSGAVGATSAGTISAQVVSRTLNSKSSDSPDLFATASASGMGAMPPDREIVELVLPLLGARIVDPTVPAAPPEALTIPGVSTIRPLVATVPQIGSIRFVEGWPDALRTIPAVRISEPLLELSAPSGSWIATGSLHVALSTSENVRSIVAMRSGCALELLTPLPAKLGATASALEFILRTDRPLPSPGRALVWLDLDEGAAIEVPISVDRISPMVQVHPPQVALLDGAEKEVLLTSESFIIVDATWVRTPPCVEVEVKSGEPLLWSVRPTRRASTRHECSTLLGVAHVRQPTDHGSPRVVNFSAHLDHDRVLRGPDGDRLIGGVFYRGERVQMLSGGMDGFELGFPDRLTAAYANAVGDRQILATTVVARDGSDSLFDWSPVIGVRVTGPVVADSAEPARVWRVWRRS